MRTSEQLTIDTKPFKPDLIEQIPGSGNRPAIDFVSWNHYTQKILATHGGHTYTVRHMEYTGSSWVVQVRIQFSDDEWYEGLGEDMSALAAESNAYKRACAHAGIGLHLYGSYWLYDYLEASNGSSVLRGGTDMDRPEPKVRMGETGPDDLTRPFDATR